MTLLMVVPQKPFPVVWTQTVYSLQFAFFSYIDFLKFHETYRISDW